MHSQMQHLYEDFNIALSTPQVVAAVRQSSVVYKAALEMKQRDRAAEEQNMRENRKRKKLIDSLEQQKRLKLDKLKSQAV